MEYNYYPFVKKMNITLQNNTKTVIVPEKIYFPSRRTNLMGNRKAS